MDDAPTAAPTPAESDRLARSWAAVDRATAGMAPAVRLLAPWEIDLVQMQQLALFMAAQHYGIPDEQTFPVLEAVRRRQLGLQL